MNRYRLDDLIEYSLSKRGRENVALAVLAAMHSDWGFLLLEGVWAIVSAYSLIELARGREPSARH